MPTLQPSQMDRANLRRRICESCKAELDCVWTWNESERDEMLNRPESLCPLAKWPT